ncbi:MAG TPA: hypothetical protein VEU32_10580 [Burkholderiales bacterium]|nr:hypothetical protein [Burkholderiales bacterium]
MLTELVTVAARLPAASLVALAPLAGLLWMCGAVTIQAAVAAMALVVVVVMACGFLLLRAAGTADMPAPAAWVLGIFATSVALYALVLAFDLLAATAFAIWTVVVLALGIVFRGHAGAFRRIERDELLGLVVCAAMTLLWCRHSAEAPAILARSGVLPVWVDYLIHGGVISSFGDVLAHGRQSIDLAGFPRPFYHFASYLLPAAFAAPLDLPGLPLATSVWLPLGFFTFCAGAYVLGQTLAGPAGGVGAVAVLTLVPEAGDYGLRNAFFDFDWHVITHPGAAYALGIAFAAFAFLKRWCDERRPLSLALSIALAAALLFFRAHIFVLALPCVVATAVIASAEFRRRPLVYVGVAAALLVVVGLTVGGGRALQPSLAVLHNQPGIAYAGWYDSLLAHYGARVALPAGVVLVFPAFLGVFTVLYPIALGLRHRSAFDAVPIVLIAGYAALMVLAPIPADGEATELTQRPFVLVYAAVAIWTIAVFVERLSLRWVLAASIAGFVALWPQSGAVGEWPKFSWGWNYYARALTPGVVQAAAYLRKEGRPGDEFAVQGLRPGWVRIDPAVELAALSGMPAYIARPYIHTLRGGERELAAYERQAVLEAVELETRPDAALAHLGASGVNWYVVTAGAGPGWDPERRLAAFSQGEVAVYRSTKR